MPIRDWPLSLAEHREHRDLIRSAVIDDLARVRRGFPETMQLDRENIFSWHGRAFWVDRVRMLVLPAIDADDWRSATTLPDDGELGPATNLVEVFGGSARMVTSSEIIVLFAWLLRDVQEIHEWSGTATHVLNLAIVQPVVNPAFEPLFWLALAHDLASPDPRSNFYDLVGPMLIDPGAPAERRTSAEARTAQIAFLESLAPGRPILDGQSLSDAEWARYCEQQLDAQRDFVGAHVFDDIWSRAGALGREPGARPLPWE